MIDRDAVKMMISSGVTRVVFTKSNGEERVMMCTTNEFEIPIDELPKGTGPTHTSEVQRVFDVEKQAWRSFRWDSVISVEVADV